MEEETQEIIKRRLLEAIRGVCGRKAAFGSFVVSDAACEVVTGLSIENPNEWAAIRDALAVAAVVRTIKAELRKTLVAADSPQLLLPGLEHLPQIIPAQGVALLSRELTLQQYRDEERRLERKLKSYDYPRREPAGRKREAAQLREMKRFDPRFAQYSANEPDLRLWKAKELDGERLQTPKAQSNRLLAAKGGRAKSDRMRNQ